MTNDLAAVQGFNKHEPIPGYVTKELIGSGGCGEVWKAHAPGGLFKAIKFVYGNMDSKAASRELRSLNRIKEVRHAFLLSVERIEVVDGNVVIVTELADQSLKQRFEKHRANGFNGLPREELLAYLRNAADALDYIYDNYSLQHLDIKPENLLLVGSRAKVADFGLIKNLYDCSVSRIEGLTPIYSPPELFEGKPNRHSDQYSLAIVYQEMLTGDLPFDGKTAARLANQHLHIPPMLSGLPKCDQPIIARALSKDPDERFPSCRAMIEALVEAVKDNFEEGRGAAAAPTHRKPAPSGALLKTESLDEALIGSAPTRATSFAASDTPGELSAIDLNDETATHYGPVLFVGIGGVAARTFRRLRRRFQDRLGGMDSIPAVNLLLLDTDVKSLNQATAGETGTALHVTETLAMPLRRPEDYRSTASKILGSTSRRWLYNIPFSLQTDGFRPLGRLAMLDHFTRLTDRLRQALVNITSEENVATTARTTGLDFASRQPRVFLVASISGGTGGGMVLDIAYAVRSILSELHLSQENVYGVLLHATPSAAGDRDKAIANSYATLSELWHYCRPGHFYPGDPACGLAPFHGNNRTFSNCYYVHLGDNLTEPRLDAATDPLAEYLYNSAVTPAARYFEKCRQMERASLEAKSSEPVVRTFGLSQLGGSNSDIPTTLAELLCRDLVSSWRSGTMTDVARTAPPLSETMALIEAHDKPKQTRFSELDKQAAVKTAELEIDLDRMQMVAREFLDQEVSSDAESYFTKLISEAFESSQVDGNDVSRVFAIVDAVLGDGSADENSNEAPFDSLDTVLKTRLEGRASKMASAVRDWTFDLVDMSQGHVEGAQHAAEWFQNYLRTLGRAATNSVSGARDQISALKEAVLREQTSRRGTGMANGPDVKWLSHAQIQLCEYARLRLEQVTLCSVTRWIRLVEVQVTTTLDRLQKFWKDLNELAAMFHVTPSLDGTVDHCAGPEVVNNHWRSLLDELMNHRQELVTALDQAIEKELAVGSFKLRGFLTQGADVRGELVMPLRVAARQLILRAMADLNMSRLADRTQNPASLDSSKFHRCVEAARPNHLDVSAASRLLIILPEGIDDKCLRASLAEQNYPPATIVRVPEGDVIVCQELEQLPLDRVAAQLVSDRGDYIELAKRLHARIDVDWDDMSTNSGPSN